MPDLDAQLLTQILLAAALAAMLALALRQVIRGRGRRGGHRRIRGSVRWSVAPARERDFGLLATVALVPSADEAARLRRQLIDAGIRATTAADRGGHRVLVFANELYRARRVGGTPT